MFTNTLFASGNQQVFFFLYVSKRLRVLGPAAAVENPWGQPKKTHTRSQQQARRCFWQSHRSERDTIAPAMHSNSAGVALQRTQSELCFWESSALSHFLSNRHSN
jgi:hypothetical protein